MTKSAVVVTHVAEHFGPPHALIDFLKRECEVLIAVTHPFSYCNDARSCGNLYVDGKLKHENRIAGVRHIESISYLKDLIITLILVSRLIRKAHLRFDVYIGADCLNAFVGLFLRRVGLIKHVVFYIIDYTPKRFKNPIVNALYKELVRLCVRSSDFVWNTSSSIARVSQSLGASSDRNLLVPHGVYAPQKLSPHPCTYKLVFVGHLLESVGVQLAIDAVSEVSKDFPKVKLYVIGYGPYSATLKKTVKEQKLEQYVKFLGLVPHSKVMSFLPECDVGLAPFKPDTIGTPWHEFADCSLNIREYLACGLPIITTRVVKIASEIEKIPAGIAINYDEKEMAEALRKFFSNNKFFKQCQRNAKKLAAGYEWDSIFQGALSKVTSKS